LRADSEALPAVCSLLPTAGFLAGVFGSDPQAARDLASFAAVALVTETGEPLNFRQGALAYTAGRERLRKSLRIPAILAVCIVIALFAELGVRWQLLRRDLASLDRSVGAIYKEVFPKRKPVDEAAEIKAEIRRLSGSGGESSPLAALKILADGLGEGISGCTEVEIDGQSIRLRGEGKSLQAVNELKGRLSQRLTALDLVESRSKGTGEVVFVLRATGLKGEAQ
jgi:general secretion pathway protein L